MSITLMCPNLKCRAVLIVPDETRGKKVVCSKCGNTLSVPGPSPSDRDKRRNR